MHALGSGTLASCPRTPTGSEGGFEMATPPPHGPVDRDNDGSEPPLLVRAARCRPCTRRCVRTAEPPSEQCCQGFPEQHTHACRDRLLEHGSPFLRED